MVLRGLLIALVAGTVAGLAVTAVQSLKLTSLIHEAETYEVAGVADHEQGDGSWAPADRVERVGFTALANVLTGIGFAMLLVAGFILSGREVTARNGLLWGLGGFAAFVLAPALQLAPELPGAASLDLSIRQAAWLGIAVATAAGIALFVFSGRSWLRAIGIALVIAPQLVSLPAAEGSGLVPPELAAEFAVLSVAIGAFFWIILGGMAGYLYGRANA